MERSHGSYSLSDEQFELLSIWHAIQGAYAERVQYVVIGLALVAVAYFLFHLLSESFELR